MTSAATQAIANTNEPAYGTILSTQVVEGGNSISLSTLFDPLLEPELIFELTADLRECRCSNHLRKCKSSSRY